MKLTDFGIAKAGSRLTTAGHAEGQVRVHVPGAGARGDGVDARTDVFALGIVLWELLTGGRLFEGDGGRGGAARGAGALIVPPARLNPDVPAALDAAVMQALERDPARRCQTAHELERALARGACWAAPDRSRTPTWAPSSAGCSPRRPRVAEPLWRRRAPSPSRCPTSAPAGDGRVSAGARPVRSALANGRSG